MIPISGSTPGVHKLASLNEDWLSARVRATPKAAALIIGSKSWSYAQLAEMVNLAANRLARKVEPGTHIAALLPNGLAFVCLIHAAARIGAVLVLLNTRLTSEELTLQLDHSRCDVLVCDSKTADQAVKLGLPQGRLIHSEALLMDSAETAEPGLPPFTFDNEAVQAIVFTSGTSGKPKGAMLTFANHFFSASASAFRLGVLPDDRWLCCLPLYHVGGLAIILRSCLYGTAVVLHERFDEAAISDSLDHDAITMISLVPTMVFRLLRYRGGQGWPHSLRHLLLGGAAAPVDLLQACHAAGIPVSTTYGLTEAASQVATMLPEDAVRKPGSVGRPLLFTSVTIADSEGQALPPDQIGEIVVSGPTVMRGYIGDEESTARVLKNGQLFTGDVGYLDAEGDLWVLQRRHDIIVSGGENVYPAEVEAVLRQHPAVEEVCVVGVEDEEWGQKVAAAIVLSESVQTAEADLLAFCREQLAGYKLPRQLIVVESLPRTSSGKVQRAAVVKLLRRR